MIGMDLRTARCSLCLSLSNKEHRYGRKLVFNNICVHYYCLLYCAGLQQKGRDDEGLLGFLPCDIEAEIKRGSRLKCRYCLVTGATAGCAEKTCPIAYHFDCGLKNFCLYQPFGQFLTYCQKHRPRQKTANFLNDALICPICYGSISTKTCVKFEFDKYLTPCCKKFFHSDCLQKYCLSAGYFCKCPLCADKKKFRKECLTFGIFIPEQDASWELENNAFNELLERHNRCDANECLCEEGRDHSDESTWSIVVCSLCGSHGTHVACSSLKVRDADDWVCEICSKIDMKMVLDDEA